MINNSMRIPRKHRVSKDLDSFNQFQMLKAYYNARLYSSVVLLFETEHGYHIQIGIKNRTPELDLHIRRALGDCKSRMELDDRRYEENEKEIIETLFGRVRKRNFWQYEHLTHPLMKPFWSVRNG